MAGRRQFDEKRTLDRALEVFWLKGYGATSMQDIATASGVLRGSLYNAYRDKETLFLHVFEDYAEQFLAEAAQALAHPSIDRALRDFFDFTFTSMTTGVPTRGCLTTKTAIDTQSRGERIRARASRPARQPGAAAPRAALHGRRPAPTHHPPGGGGAGAGHHDPGDRRHGTRLPGPRAPQGTADSLIDALLPPVS